MRHFGSGFVFSSSASFSPLLFFRNSLSFFGFANVSLPQYLKEVFKKYILGKPAKTKAVTGMTG